MVVKGKKVTVVGLAKSGQAAARLAHQLGADVRVMDCRPAAVFDKDFLAWLSSENIAAEFEKHTDKMIQDADMVVVSPGVPYNAAPLQWARQRGVPVIGEVEFAFCFCPCPVVAVTGSNGKTTVTTLIGRVLAESGRKVFVGGNIGRPLCDEVLLLTADHIVVLEISSFQLETIDTFRPKVVVFLNISQNHLDRHADMEEYFKAKKQIFKNQTGQDFAVLNAADPLVESLAAQVASKIVWFNTEQQAHQTGYDNPNFLAVNAAASVFSIDPACCRKVFENFQGIEHRFETVREKDGVVFINDSKATTVESGRWALTRLNQPVVWICGGRDKLLDFTPLRDIAGQKVKKIIAIGEAALKVKGVFSDVVPVECFTDFTQAVHAAARDAQQGDAVLLSPMCASFDMFENFEHRGREFKRIVGEL